MKVDVRFLVCRADMGVSQLPDPHGVLAGKGKLRRHIRIDAKHNIEAKRVEEYLDAARAH